MMEAYGVKGLNMMIASTLAFWLESMTRHPSLIDTSKYVCIKIRGLPYNVGRRDILDFLEGYNILAINIHILMGAMTCSIG